MRKLTSIAELNLLGIVGYPIEVIPNVPDAQQKTAQRPAYETPQTGQCLAGGYTYCLPVNRESRYCVESEDFLVSNTDSDSFMRDDLWHEIFR